MSALGGFAYTFAGARQLGIMPLPTLYPVDRKLNQSQAAGSCIIAAATASWLPLLPAPPSCSAAPHKLEAALVPQPGSRGMGEVAAVQAQLPAAQL